MGPIIGIMNILEVNFYFCTFLAEILRYFDNGNNILQKTYRTNTISPFIIYELRISTEMASGVMKANISGEYENFDLNILL